ncbi:TPM domain-containing protein [bacterium]|nr:TPM domain-containing protein [bacterium]
MIRSLICKLFLATLCFTLPLSAFALIEIPELTGRVVDLSSTLTGPEKAVLENGLAQFEKEKGSQIAVLILPTTAGEAIESFGIRLAETWKIGREKINDGVILIVAKQDRSMRIEVGYGLEGALPDAICKRIISEIITPRFQAGEFGQGITEGVWAMQKAIAGEKLPLPQYDSTLVDLFPVFVVLGLFLASILKYSLGRKRGATIAALVTCVLSLFALSFLTACIAGLIVFIFSSLENNRTWGTGRYSTSSGGGWSSGGGGFSGGGGSFGGGGASGRW